MTALVTGGAGYIGSHMALALLERGEDVVVLDNLSTGVRDLVPVEARFVHGNVGNRSLVGKLITEQGIDCVFHFAGSSVVPDSVADPLRYYANNTANSRNLIEACVETGVNHFIFSSTAAVYGATETASIEETADKSPINPYGRSKLMIEWVLQDTAQASDLRYVALRYFNVAGADPLGRTGQSTPRATHLIKRACQTALGRLPHLGIFGVDFPTPDGTGVRDYIHVSDLVAAHALALDHLRALGESSAYNCGYGHGFSVREVIDAVERACGRKLPVMELPRRPGDPPAVVADSAKLKQRLGWRPRYDALDLIVRDALAWEDRVGQAETSQMAAAADARRRRREFGRTAAGPADAAQPPA
ncbi:UDP-glucose 4-epimerase GalE [Phenylobacterium sp. LjRoot225]|uniref:UDP-glucose 4-epimerase GalE n=1 Tax=Phenylobacterium sp. LjRoot225 TaxID=3342285 RepID=UPI003ED1254D